MGLNLDQKRQAIQDFMRIYGQSAYHALLDIINDDLEAARDELENVEELNAIYRAQGKCQALKHLISTISPK